MPRCARVIALVIILSLPTHSVAAPELTLDDLDREQPPRPDEAAAAPHAGVERTGQAGTVPIIIDPELAKSVDGNRGFTPREMREIGQLADRAVAQARMWLRRPAAQEYFQKHFKLEPVKLLDETGMTVNVVSLTHRGDGRSGEYHQDTRTIRLTVREFYVAIRGQWLDQWVPNLAAKVVHELVHAAARDSGNRYYEKPGEDDEGTIAEKTLGVYDPRAPEWMMDLKWLLHEVEPRR